MAAAILLFDAPTLRRIGVEAGRDPRTVKAALEGKASPQARAAVEAALARLGIELPAAPAPFPQI